MLYTAEDRQPVLVPIVERELCPVACLSLFLLDQECVFIREVDNNTFGYEMCNLFNLLNNTTHAFLLFHQIDNRRSKLIREFKWGEETTHKKRTTIGQGMRV